LREIRKAALQTHEGKQPEEAQALVRIELPCSTHPILGNTPASAIRMHYKGFMRIFQT
jgi:hypothetical protein